MSQSTLPGVQSSDTDDVPNEDQDEADEIECACELGEPGCWDHFREGQGLEIDDD